MDINKFPLLFLGVQSSRNQKERVKDILVPVHSVSCFLCWMLIKINTRAPFVHGSGDFPVAREIFKWNRDGGGFRALFAHGCGDLLAVFETMRPWWDSEVMNGATLPLSMSVGTSQLLVKTMTGYWSGGWFRAPFVYTRIQAVKEENQQSELIPSVTTSKTCFPLQDSLRPRMSIPHLQDRKEIPILGQPLTLLWHRPPQVFCQLWHGHSITKVHGRSHVGPSTPLVTQGKMLWISLCPQLGGTSSFLQDHDRLQAGAVLSVL